MTKTVCNMCGKEFDVVDNNARLRLGCSVGYGSKYDGSVVECDLCCDCFDKLLDEYLIPRCKHPIVNPLY